MQQKMIRTIDSSIPEYAIKGKDAIKHIVSSVDKMIM